MSAASRPQALQKFRSEAREWLDANCPQSCRGPRDPKRRVYPGKNIRFPDDDSRLWFERMVAKGWCMPEYPKEYGGGGLGAEESQIVREEMRALGCCEPQVSMGIVMVAPVLMEFGTPEQKAEFLPRIARGEIRWCQGYSEPGAGSDLASLRTAAVDRGDHYVVNGSKIWTTDADSSDWMFCLARTDPDAPKRQGISFLLFSMDQPGVDARQIRMISGATHNFCEVFLDDVRAEKAHRIGPENQGWQVAKHLLVHERALMSDLATASGVAIDARDIAKECLAWSDGRIAEPALRERLARHLINRKALDLLTLRCAEESAAGVLSAAGAGLKYAGSEEEKRRQSLVADMLGFRAMGWDDEEHFTARELTAVSQWLSSRAYSIAGGSSEIQLNLIAQRVLDLPKE